jgi:hypothetical protein
MGVTYLLGIPDALVLFANRFYTAYLANERKPCEAWRKIHGMHYGSSIQLNLNILFICV